MMLRRITNRMPRRVTQSPGSGKTPEAILGAQVLYDAARGYTLVSGLVSALQAYGSGAAAADTAVQATPASRLLWTASDSDFGGYPSIGPQGGLGHTEALEAAGSAVIAQPDTLVVVCKANSLDTTLHGTVDGAGSTNRQVLFLRNLHYMYAGAYASSIAGQTTQAEAIYVRWSGAASTIETYQRDGTRTGPTTVNPGTDSIQGIAICNNKDASSGDDVKVALVAVVPGLLSVTKQAIFETWLQSRMGFTP